MIPLDHWYDSPSTRPGTIVLYGFDPFLLIFKKICAVVSLVLILPYFHPPFYYFLCLFCFSQYIDGNMLFIVLMTNT